MKEVFVFVGMRKRLGIPFLGNLWDSFLRQVLSSVYDVVIWEQFVLLSFISVNVQALLSSKVREACPVGSSQYIPIAFFDTTIISPLQRFPLIDLGVLIAPRVLTHKWYVHFSYY